MKTVWILYAADWDGKHVITVFDHSPSIAETEAFTTARPWSGGGEFEVLEHTVNAPAPAPAHEVTRLKERIAELEAEVEKLRSESIW